MGCSSTSIRMSCRRATTGAAERQRAAALRRGRRAGTAVLFATPHVLAAPEAHGPERERTIRANSRSWQRGRARPAARLRADAVPAAARAGPGRYSSKERPRAVEVPFTGGVELLVAIASDRDAGSAARHRAPGAHAVGARASRARAELRRARLAAAGERQLADRAARPGNRGAGVGARRRRARRARRVRRPPRHAAGALDGARTPRSCHREWGRLRRGRSSTGRRSGLAD